MATVARAPINAAVIHPSNAWGLVQRIKVSRSSLVFFVCGIASIQRFLARVKKPGLNKAESR